MSTAVAERPVKVAPAAPAVVDDYQSVNHAEDEAIREELRDIVDTLYGARLPSARDYLMYLMDVENKIEDELAANSPGFQASMRRAEEDARAGRTTPWHEVRKLAADRNV